MPVPGCVVPPAAWSAHEAAIRYRGLDSSRPASPGSAGSSADSSPRRGSALPRRRTWRGHRRADRGGKRGARPVSAAVDAALRDLARSAPQCSPRPTPGQRRLSRRAAYKKHRRSKGVASRRSSCELFVVRPLVKRRPGRLFAPWSLADEPSTVPDQGRTRRRRQHQQGDRASSDTFSRTPCACGAGEAPCTQVPDPGSRGGSRVAGRSRARPVRAAPPRGARRRGRRRRGSRSPRGSRPGCSSPRSMRARRAGS